MRLRTKLLIGFLSTPVFLFGHSLGVFFGVSAARTDVLSLQRLIQTTDLMSQAAGEIAAVAHPEEIEIGIMRTSLRASESPAILALLTARLTRARMHLQSLDDLAREPQSKASLAGAMAALQAYQAATLRFADAMLTEGPAGARGTARQGAVEAFENLNGVVDRFVHSLGEESRRAVTEVARRLGDQAATLAGTSLVIVLILTIIMAIALAGLSTRDILRLHRAARRVAAGDLDLILPVRTSDEIGELTRAFNDMTRRLHEIYHDLEARVLERTEALRKSEGELHRTQRLAALGRLSAGVAHELGGPLTIIAAAAEGLRDRARSPELRDLAAFEDFPDYLELVENEAYRLKKVIRRLLDFARPKPPELAPLDFAEVVRNAVELARLDPRARKTRLELKVPPDRSIELAGDFDRLQELTLNLLFNALDAAGDGGHVEVIATALSEEAILTVRDDGVGIAPEHLPQIFEPFFTTKPEGAGTGLGLALVAGTVEAHAGRVTAYSDGPGRGSLFEVRLPRYRGKGLAVASGPGVELLDESLEGSGQTPL